MKSCRSDQKPQAEETDMALPITANTVTMRKYNDYANEEFRDHSPIDGPGLNGTNKSHQQAFPLKLHYMLSDIEADGLTHIVSWRPHGRCFAILNQKELVEKLLPRWFQQSKFASFQRQLNLYGFQRITSGPDKGCYYHELFLRGKQFLCHRIQRVKVKGTTSRKKRKPEDEPNFYNLTPLPPTTISSKMPSEYGGFLGHLTSVGGSCGVNVSYDW